MKAAFSILFVTALTANARAEGEAGKPDLSYLYDGGAVPLFWIPLAGGLAIDQSVTPRSTPLLFDSHEGGATPSSWEVPSWSVTVAGAGVAGLIGVASDDPSRYRPKEEWRAWPLGDPVTRLLRLYLPVRRRRVDGAGHGSTVALYSMQ